MRYAAPEVAGVPDAIRSIDAARFYHVGGGAAATWPLAARVQQLMPVIGFLNSQSPDNQADYLQAFRRGLKESGYVEGENVAVEYRWAENKTERLPALAGELVRRRVAVIAASGGLASESAAKATATIPIVFMVPEDPVRMGLVTSLARPGGNLTGVNFFAAELAAKRLGLLRELVPAVTRVAVLLNPAEATIAASNLRDMQTAARDMRLQIQVFNASTSGELDAAFATIARDRPDALVISSGAFFTGRRVQLAHLATHHRIPAIHGSRFYPEVGGLISYGTSVSDSHREAGVYVGRILKGAKPADLPVVQSSKFELVINAHTAKLLGLTVPPTLLSTADEVIE
jgi:putative tryptophan/tyrosine transport system substrate-binding protein